MSAISVKDISNFRGGEAVHTISPNCEVNVSLPRPLQREKPRGSGDTFPLSYGREGNDRREPLANQAEPQRAEDVLGSREVGQWLGLSDRSQMPGGSLMHC